MRSVRGKDTFCFFMGLVQLCFCCIVISLILQKRQSNSKSNELFSCGLDELFDKSDFRFFLIFCLQFYIKEILQNYAQINHKHFYRSVSI